MYMCGASPACAMCCSVMRVNVQQCVVVAVVQCAASHINGSHKRVCKQAG